jgi:hypothetical protein
VFAADLPAQQAAVMAATQRPVSELAFSEPSGPPAWKSLPQVLPGLGDVPRVVVVVGDLCPATTARGSSASSL